MLKETNENTEDNCFRLKVKLRWMHSMFPRKEGSDNINESLQKIKQKKNVYNVLYFTYFSINFLWNSDRSVSFTKRFSFRASSTPLAQFLNKTSWSHLKKLTKCWLAEKKLTVFFKYNILCFCFTFSWLWMQTESEAVVAVVLLN